MVARLAGKCAKSIREAIPGARIVQFTDERTPIFSFADEAIRRPIRNLGFMEFRIHHFASYPHKEMLFLDADTIVQKDPWDVFLNDFDVALTARAEPLTSGGVDVTDQMPYNTGVMFSKGTKFWRKVCEGLKAYPLDARNWFGEQVEIAKVVKSGQFNVLEVSDAEYNYTPKKRDEDVSSRYIVHYKGKRKEWML
jgi:lipopolysaccharide biosynthesis glycosyltransferase